MFIRIKKRKLSDKWFNFGNTIAYDAVLIESYRNNEGKPRQRYLLHLATIRDHHTKLPHTLRKFYEEIECRLTEYGVDAVQINKLVSKLEQRFGAKPSEEEAEEYLRKAWKMLDES